MAKKKKLLTKGTADLNVNDALRLATADERFFKSIISDPEKYRKVFNLKNAEIKALRELPKKPGPGTAMDYDA